MNGYQLTRQWFEWRFNNPGKLSSSHAELYFYIVDRWNYFNQKSEFGLPRLHTMEVLSIGSRNTYKKLFNDLIEYGFIKLIRESSNQYHHASIIALSKFEQAPDTPLDTPTEQAIEQAPDPIDKPINLGTKEYIDIKPKAKKKKEKAQFVPPTIEQIQDYFNEKAYPLQLVEKVFNHYNDKQWHKSNGQPVIDWKRTISNNWEDHFQQWRQRQTQNATRGNSQLPVDPSQIVNYGKGNGNCLFDKRSKKWYEPLHNGYPPKEIEDYAYLDQGNHSNYGEYVKWMLRNNYQPLPPEDTRYFPDDWNFEKFISEQKAILAKSNQ